MYQIYYLQTPRERYGGFKDKMNERVRHVLDEAGLKIVEEFGGSMIGGGADDLIAENGFVVDTSLEALNRISGEIQGIVGREITVTEV